MPKVRVFNAALLSEVMIRDGATLIGDYEKLNSSIKIFYKCKCGTEASKQFNMLVNRCYATCRACSIEAGKERQKSTMLSKYGVTNALLSQEIKDKVRSTVLQKYGVTCVLQNSVIKAKAEEISLTKYGVKNPFQSESIKDKIKATNLEKYGCENPMQNPEIQKKLEQTSLEKYGTRRPSENATVRSKIQESHLDKTEEEREAIRQKVIATSLQHYGVPSPNQADEVKQAKAEACMEKYGVENPMQNKELQEKVQNRAKKFKNYTMPSGAVRRVQGYEPFALDILLKEFTEEQIVTERKLVPRIAYPDGEKQRYHFPDIFIPHTNTLIEVKSTWTYKCTTDNVQKKAAAAAQQGYVYEIWVFNGKGDRVEHEIFKS